MKMMKKKKITTKSVAPPFPFFILKTPPFQNLLSYLFSFFLLLFLVCSSSFQHHLHLQQFSPFLSFIQFQWIIFLLLLLFLSLLVSLFKTTMKNEQLLSFLLIPWSSIPPAHHHYCHHLKLLFLSGKGWNVKLSKNIIKADNINNKDYQSFFCQVYYQLTNII